MGHPLRVAYVVSRFPKLSETFILYEMLELERLGIDVDLYALVREPETALQPGAASFVERMTVVRRRSRTMLAAQWHWLRRRPGRYLGTWWGALWGNRRSLKFLVRAVAVVPTAAAFARRIEARGTDHVHAHWATHPALAAWVVHRLTGTSYSFTGHAHDLYVERSMLDVKIRDAAAVITISEYNRRLLAGWYGTLADKVEVVHCGVDVGIFHPRPDGPPARRDGPFELVTVATLQPQKGHAYLVDAVGLLRDRRIPVRATFVGEGEERPALEARIAAADLADRVILVGRQPRDQVAALVRAADVVVQPSVILPDGKTEGIPVALMEAMASGTPVIATAVSGVPELVEDGVTGRLVPPGDPEALAAAITVARDDEIATARMAAAGRRRVAASFDLRIETRRLAEGFILAARANGRQVEALGSDEPAGG